MEKYENRQECPIGVFDSGVGGISVLRELVAQMPNENYIFFGDSKNAPYGTKTLEEVQKLTCADAEYLLSRGVKALVVACNTATSAAIHILREKYQKEIPVIGIEPALKPAVSVKENPKGKLKCIFFSQVSEDKGSDIVIEAARLLPEVHFDIYGRLVDEYASSFTAKIETLDNVKYCGIYKGSDIEKYILFQNYDVLLFPTRCETEGVPGTLVEAKFAGIPCVVSNVSHNAELVLDDKEGIVLRENTVACMIDAIVYLDKNRERLLEMKKNSLKSAGTYYIDNYIDNIVSQLSNEKSGGYSPKFRFRAFLL